MQEPNYHSARRNAAYIRSVAMQQLAELYIGKLVIASAIGTEDEPLFRPPGEIATITIRCRTFRSIPLMLETDFPQLAYELLTEVTADYLVFMAQRAYIYFLEVESEAGALAYEKGDKVEEIPRCWMLTDPEELWERFAIGWGLWKNHYFDGY